MPRKRARMGRFDKRKLRVKKLYYLEPRVTRTGRVLIKKGRLAGYFVSYVGTFQKKADAVRTVSILKKMM